MIDAIFYFFAFIGVIVFTAYFIYNFVSDVRYDIKRRKALNDFLEGKKPPKQKEDEEDD